MSFVNLLVPLDGSLLAESVLPAVSVLAGKFSAQVTLLHMIEQGASPRVHGERHLVGVTEAENYLAEVSSRPVLAGLSIDRHVHTAQVKDVARSIVDHAREIQADLVVICTHGEGGFRSWVLGSIAQQVLAGGETPVLLVQALRNGEPLPFTCQRILVPLDGQVAHEQGALVALELAKSFQSTLHLVMVIHTLHTLPSEQVSTAIFLPGTTSAILDSSLDSAYEYLHAQVARLSSPEIALTSEVRRGDSVKAILSVSRRFQADLIVLGTHARTAMDGFWAGSFTRFLLSRTRLPILLVPVRKETHAT